MPQLHPPSSLPQQNRVCTTNRFWPPLHPLRPLPLFILPFIALPPCALPRPPCSAATAGAALSCRPVPFSCCTFTFHLLVAVWKRQMPPGSHKLQRGEAEGTWRGRRPFEGKAAAGRARLQRVGWVVQEKHTAAAAGAAWATRARRASRRTGQRAGSRQPRRTPPPATSQPTPAGCSSSSAAGQGGVGSKVA